MHPIYTGCRCLQVQMIRKLKSGVLYSYIDKKNYELILEFRNINKGDVYIRWFCFRTKTVEEGTFPKFILESYKKV
jgi:hypothetical protein